MSVDEILLRSRYNPLKRILAYDVFNTGFNGWMTLLPNFTEYPDFDVPPTLVNKDQWPPVMLSSATFRYPGTHGAIVMVLPEKGRTARMDKELADKLEAYKNSLSQEEVEELVARTHALE